MENILNFEGRKLIEEAIVSTWNEFRDALAKGKFEYLDIDAALKCTYMKQLDDFFNIHGCKEMYTKTLNDIFSPRNEVLRGTKLTDDKTPDYERFLPKREYITEDNRFSPERVEWLYLAIGDNEKHGNIAKNCTIKECKAESGQRFGTCHFKINSAFCNSKLVDLTIGCKYSFNELEENIEKELQNLARKTVRDSKRAGIYVPVDRNMFDCTIKKWSSHFYAKLMSEQLFLPVNANKKLMYSPFQCLATYFNKLGYEGIIYSSVVYPEGTNVVLFDKTMAIPYGDIETFHVI